MEHMKISGGHNIVGGNNAIGAFGNNATNVNYGGGGPADAGLAELDRRIADLRELIDRHAARIADPPAAREAVDAVAEEARNGGAGSSRIRLMLNAVAGAAPGVTAVTQLVQELLRLVAPTPS